MTARELLIESLKSHEDRLSHCVHCGFCLPACPTYVRLGDEADSPRGRLHLMRAVVEGRLEPASDAFQVHLDRCLGCRACESVCPSGVEYGLLLERARSVAAEARPTPAATRALLATMARPWPRAVFSSGGRALRFTRVPALLARILPSRGLPGRLRLAMGMLAATAPPRWPAPPRGDAGGPDPEDRARESATVSRPGSPAPSRPRVGLLRGCVQDGLFGRVNRATRDVLEANGFDVVDVPGQGCCGALHAHSGALSGARALARRNVDAFRKAGVEAVVVNAAGCGAVMKEYGELLEGRSPEERGAARWVSERVRDISEILAGDGRRPRPGAPLGLRVAYDPPCHLLHGQRVIDPPLEMLRSVPRLQVDVLPDGDHCCGGAGIYGLTHPELGGQIGGDKVASILASGCDVVATGNPGCQMQIGAGLRMAGRPIPVVHPIELLAESYRRLPTRKA